MNISRLEEPAPPGYQSWPETIRSSPRLRCEPPAFAATLIDASRAGQRFRRQPRSSSPLERSYSRAVCSRAPCGSSSSMSAARVRSTTTSRQSKLASLRSDRALSTSRRLTPGPTSRPSGFAARGSRLSRGLPRTPRPSRIPSLAISKDSLPSAPSMGPIATRVTRLFGDRVSQCWRSMRRGSARLPCANELLHGLAVLSLAEGESRALGFVDSVAFEFAVQRGAIRT